MLGPLRLDELGWGAVAIGVTFALGGVTQAVVNPIAGRMADVHGRIVPLRIGLLAAAAVSGLLALDDSAWLYAFLAVCAATAFGTLWTPATAALVDTVAQRGLDQAACFG